MISDSRNPNVTIHHPPTWRRRSSLPTPPCSSAWLWIFAWVLVFTSTMESSSAAYSWTQTAELLNPDPAADDQFGTTALSGDTLAVGAPFDDALATNAGALYVYTRSAGAWSAPVKIQASDGASSWVAPEFGTAVALDGDAMVVGARNDSRSVYTMYGGAFYIFRKVGGSWTQSFKYLGGGTSGLGSSVAISGGTIAAGAPGVSSATVGVWNGSAWVTQGTVRGSDTVTSDSFGSSVAVAGDWLAVGARFAAVNGNYSGATYIFHRVGSTWTQTQKLVGDASTTAGSAFGCVSMSGDTLIVGAPGGLAGGEGKPGATFVYRRVGSAYSLESKLTTPGSGNGTAFGCGVVQGERMVIADPYATGPSGVTAAAQFYRRFDSAWVLQSTALLPSVASQLIEKVALDGTTAAAGHIVQTVSSVPAGAVWTYSESPADIDGDGVSDDVDDCPIRSNPGQEDADGDGLGDACDTCTDADHDSYGAVGSTTCAGSGLDCRDSDASVHPGATEVCNDLDDDCDSEVDEGLKTRFFRDADGDGFGDPAVAIEACASSNGYVTDNTDCDDSAGGVHPGSAETCNEIDDDCDQQVDEGLTSTFFLDVDGDGYGDPAHPVQACQAGGGIVANATDCNDASSAVSPGQPEVAANGIDDDCNPATADCLDADHDGYSPSGGACGAIDCNDANASVNPARTEIPSNGIDDDCNSATPGGCSQP